MFSNDLLATADAMVGAASKMLGSLVTPAVSTSPTTPLHVDHALAISDEVIATLTMMPSVGIVFVVVYRIIDTELPMVLVPEPILARAPEHNEAMEIALDMFEKMSTAMGDQLAQITGLDQPSAVTGFVTQEIALPEPPYDAFSSALRISEDLTIAVTINFDEHAANELRGILATSTYGFEEITFLSNHALQRSLREVNMKDLALALKGASDDLIQRVFASMSERRAEELAEDISLLGPQRVSDVVRAQRYVVDAILALAKKRVIKITRLPDFPIAEDLIEDAPAHDLVTVQGERPSFAFDDIAGLDDRSIQRMLKDLGDNTLALALATSSEDLLRRILRNMSKRSEIAIREMIKSQGSQSVDVVREAQQKVVDIVLMLAENGSIAISPASGDDRLI